MSTRWHIVRKIPLNQIHRFPRSVTIGTASRNGTVRPLSYKGNNVLFVSKEVPLRKKNSFIREVHVGSMKGIEACGPRVYAWRITKDKCEYIMDHLARGDTRAKVSTLYDYIGEKPWRKLYDVLLKFYKVTGGYHGDLHQTNVAVIKKGSRVSVQVYDYGTWHPFYKRVSGNKIFPYLLAAQKKPGNRVERNGVYEPRGGGQLYQKNINSLSGKALNAFRRFNQGRSYSNSNSQYTMESL